MSSPSTPDRTSGLWRVVAEREVTTQLRSRTFLVSGAVLVLGLIALIVTLELTSGRTSTDTVAVVDDTAATAVEAGSVVLQQTSGGDEIEARRYDDAAAAEQAVRDGDVNAALLPAGDDGQGGYEVVGDDSVDASLSGALTSAVAGTVTQANAERQGVDLQQLTSGTEVRERLLDPDSEDAGLRQVASLVFVLLFYLTALGFGMQIASTVTQEKESRVVEILAAAIPIRALLWGKVIGSSVLAIGQTVVLAAVGVVGLLVTGNTDALTVLGPAIAWYVLFFVIGFVALASFWSVAGSLAGRQQDLQATTLPLQIILFAPYIVTFTAGESVRTVMSMFPIVSTMLMPSRLAEGDVPLWQLGVAIATTLLAALLLVRLAAQVYERTLLQTGRKIGYGEALRRRAAG